jgi:glycosyltransferase involved in cell wall biosynthesis
MISYLHRKVAAEIVMRAVKYAWKPLPVLKIARTADAVPKISIIIPTYNWSSVLRLAIRSALLQTERDFELLVIGDGCTDDSAEVAASFGDARVRWHNLAVNSGHQSAPNNAGLRMARGEYIAMLGHDDIWHPDHLRSLRMRLESTGADFVSAWTEMIGPPGSNFRLITGIFPEGGFRGAESLVPSGVMFRRAVMEKVGEWKDYRTIPITPDLDFVRRAVDAGFRFESTRELTVLKFNSALRKNCYREKASDEQAACMQAIESDRWFMLREALRVAKVHWFREPMQSPEFDPPPEGAEMGRRVAQYRKFRGLE